MELSDFSDSELSDLPDHNTKHSLADILRERKNKILSKLEGESKHEDIVCQGCPSNRVLEEKGRENEGDQENKSRVSEQMEEGRVVRGMDRIQLPPEQPPKKSTPLLLSITEKQIISQPREIRPIDLLAQNQPEQLDEGCIHLFEEQLQSQRINQVESSENEQSSQRYQLIDQGEVIGRQWALTSQRDNILSQIQSSLQNQRKPAEKQEIIKELKELESVYEDRGISQKPEYMKFWIPQMKMRNREKYIEFLNNFLDKISRATTSMEVLKIANSLLSKTPGIKTSKSAPGIKEQKPLIQIAISDQSSQNLSHPVEQEQLKSPYRVIEQESSSKFKDSSIEDREVKFQFTNNDGDKSTRGALMLQKMTGSFSKITIERLKKNLKNASKRKPQILDLTISSDEQIEKNKKRGRSYCQGSLEPHHEQDSRHHNRDDEMQDRPQKKRKLNSGIIHCQQIPKFPSSNSAERSTHTKTKDELSQKR